jgi:hypothetical protein
MKTAYLALMVLFLAPALSHGAHPLENGKAPDFTLADQYDRPFHLADARGSIIVLLAADGEAEAQLAPWRTKLAGRYADRVVMLGIADVRSAPFFLKRHLKNRFKKNPDRVLLDWNGDFFTAYGLPGKAPSIVAIDRTGTVRSVRSGDATASALQDLFNDIDRLMKE